MGGMSTSFKKIPSTKDDPSGGVVFVQTKVPGMVKSHEMVAEDGEHVIIKESLSRSGLAFYGCLGGLSLGVVMNLAIVARQRQLQRKKEEAAAAANAAPEEEESEDLSG